MKVLSIVLVLVLLAGCAPSSEQLTVTAVMAQAQTQTAAPTLTATPPPTLTSTPRPTNTPFPTPAPIQGTVRYHRLEMTLLQVETHSHIVTSENFYYYSKPGRIYIDMAVLVRNAGANPFVVAAKDIVVSDERAEQMYPNFIGFQSVEIGESFDPMTNIRFHETKDWNEAITFQKDTYLRLIWYIEKNQSILFGIWGWPQFILSVE